jgi:DNA mismatch endonuclease (patch repair protein)
MQANRSHDTGPELLLRHLLHAAGLRYRVNWPVPGASRRLIDVAFTRWRVAVFVDGCFWHRCPIHYVAPKANSEFWDAKLQSNVERDNDTTTLLVNAGWLVLRFWEHEDPQDVAAQVAQAVRDAAKRLER